MSERPNIIWIFPDEWRHDAFGYRGNTVIQTPNIDALAQRGVVFTNAHCESPVCQSSRASLLTGMYPSQHGMHDNEHLGPTAGTFPDAGTGNFLHALRKAGYRTAEIGKMHFARSMFGKIDEYGFDDVYEEYDKYVLGRIDTPYTRYLKEKGLLEKFAEHNGSLLGGFGRRFRNQAAPAAPMPAPAARPKAEPDVVPAEDYLDAFIGRSACDYIRNYERDQPFFLWVAPIGPHPPFDGPPKYSDQYEPATIPLGPLGFDEFPDNRWGQYLQSTVQHLRCDSYTEDDYRLIGKYYYGSGSLIDEEVVGAIVRTLAETGRDRDTWIFFSSDHGEMLGDHGFYSKRIFYKTSVQVPMIVAPPVGVEAGHVVDGLVQGFDVTGSIVNLAGTPWLDERSGGASVVDSITGTDTTRSAVYSQIAGFTMVNTGEHKFVVHTESREPGALYDLVNDPDERRNLVGDNGAKSQLDQMMGLFDEFATKVGA